MLLCITFFFNDPATTEIYTLSLHDALPIFGHPKEQGAERRTDHSLSRYTSEPSPSQSVRLSYMSSRMTSSAWLSSRRSEEHTSELQSRRDLVCRLLLEKKKKKKHNK